MTVSVGGSLKDQIDHIDDAIKRADECLYKAKRLGRKRAVVDWKLDDVAPTFVTNARKRSA